MLLQSTAGGDAFHVHRAGCSTKFRSVHLGLAEDELYQVEQTTVVALGKIESVRRS